MNHLPEHHPDRIAARDLGRHVRRHVDFLLEMYSAEIDTTVLPTFDVTGVRSGTHEKSMGLCIAPDGRSLKIERNSYLPHRGEPSITLALTNCSLEQRSQSRNACVTLHELTMRDAFLPQYQEIYHTSAKPRVWASPVIIDREAYASETADFLSVLQAGDIADLDVYEEMIEAEAATSAKALHAAVSLGGLWRFRRSL